jgi:glucose-1-phosphatase
VNASSAAKTSDVASEIDLVCFDLGRVLIRLCDDWRHACSTVGIEPREPPQDAEAKRRFSEIGHLFDSGRIALEEYAARIAPLRGLSREQAIHSICAYVQGPFPGAAELLEELSVAGVRTACLSNTNETHWRMITEPGPTHLPLHRLTYRFASHLVGARKPDPEIYAHVERKTGCRGDRILFFDDVPENITAAAQRGWRGHVIERGHDPIEQIRAVLTQLRLLMGR